MSIETSNDLEAYVESDRVTADDVVHQLHLDHLFGWRCGIVGFCVGVVEFCVGQS